MPVSFGVAEGRIRSFAVELDEVRGDGCVYTGTEYSASGNGNYSMDVNEQCIHDPHRRAHCTEWGGTDSDARTRG